MKRFTRLSYSFLTATLLTTAACGDDGEGAEFASATLTQKQRAVSAAAGLDAAIGFLYGSLMSSLPAETACPTIAIAGDTITATGGCTDDNGDRFEGKLIAKNVPGFFGGPENDPTKPAVVTFEGFAIDDTSDDNQDLAFDGVVTLEPDGRLVAALSATLEGIAVHTDATWRQTADERQTADDGSSIELDGLGSADIKGTWSTDTEAPSGVLELHGADVLKANFGAVDGNGCVPLTIDGQSAGQLCNESEL